mmetsp:Transcript_13425/g.22090  ORF Transcript_13425/g.22090 Transcript_13425/m.22090 type:complete len:134 (+) Transcript_13425:61-462(+)|eukprot:CAMPEP_0169141158 /NCGR_PEP_ID=MMETSP1015-20121227/44125_1 /TAXON_ID=342587 /ORGANISM="Karlodinium micrum, Strain CCMP2283" /LENGTH=133 /DNA_ID=CAMNT_0009207455 /DNA_START=59 /DNA_END=460 /DNA_ORIENTATION=+
MASAGSESKRWRLSTENTIFIVLSAVGWLSVYMLQGSSGGRPLSLERWRHEISMSGGIWPFFLQCVGVMSLLVAGHIVLLAFGLATAKESYRAMKWATFGVMVSYVVIVSADRVPDAFWLAMRKYVTLPDGAH